MKSIARQMGIRGRTPKACALYGRRLAFTARDGGAWTVNCDSTGYFYAALDNVQVTSTAYGYAFSTEGALIKALAELARA